VARLDETPRAYGVSAKDREPLIAFMLDALRGAGCQIIHEPSPTSAPFRITFETPTGERIGLMVYAFLANSRLTKNRPDDEHRFQIKYGSKLSGLHDLWQDPFGLYVTLFVGINSDEGFFVAADPVLHSPTKFFISLEFKQAEVDEILRGGWHCWERDRRTPGATLDDPAEVLVGGTGPSFLRYVRFERDAVGEDQGHRQLLAEGPQLLLATAAPLGPMPTPSTSRIHELAHEFEMSESAVLDLIAGARRLKMAVRGWVAEEHHAQDCARRGEQARGPPRRGPFSAVASVPQLSRCRRAARLVF